jgi:hypothetical protein
MYTVVDCDPFYWMALESVRAMVGFARLPCAAVCSAFPRLSSAEARLNLLRGQRMIGREGASALTGGCLCLFYYWRKYESTSFTLSVVRSLTAASSRS